MKKYSFIHENHKSPAFRFEYLLRAVFDNCGKGKDPWGYARQEFYSELVDLNIQGKRALSVGLTKLIYDNKENDKIDDLIKIENRIWIAEKQTDIVSIINESISWIEDYVNKE